MPPGGTQVVDCQIDRHPAKEITTQISVACQSPSVECSLGSGVTGMVNVLVPDESVIIGDSFVSPFEVEFLDPNGNGLVEPGETIELFISLVNAGPVTLNNVQARLSAPMEVDVDGDGIPDPVDVDGDGIPDPVFVTSAVSTYPPIQGADIVGGTGSGDCGQGVPLTPVPSVNSTPFSVVIPAEHPADTARLLQLTVCTDGCDPAIDFVQEVSLVLGVASPQQVDSDSDSESSDSDSESSDSGSESSDSSSDSD